MSANRHMPHIMILPEDDANASIATGFLLEVPAANLRKIQILNEAGGWSAVIDRFCKNEAPAMRKFDQRAMILLLDFDNDPNRSAKIRQRIPPDLIDRVFLLGVHSEPEALKRDLGQNFEQLGSSMARDCQSDQPGIWQHPLLEHNLGEIARIKAAGWDALILQ